MLELTPLDLDGSSRDELDARQDQLVFQRRPWLEYVASEHSAELLVCAVASGSTTVGFFTGLGVRKLGVPILGSPLPGWRTGYLGFNLDEGVPGAEALAALRRLALKELGYAHVEVRDRALGLADADGWAFEPFSTFEVDLLGDEDAIFGRMASACRRCIRKAEKVGVTIEEADDLDFADEYYAQLEDVFAKQSLRPTYTAECVRALIRHVQPSGELLLLRARRPDGKCIATGIFPGHGPLAYFWGGASWREDQILRPNEAIFWYAMRYWKRRGAHVLDMGGGGEYKRKYGGVEKTVPHLMQSRIHGLRLARRAVSRARTFRRVHQGASG